MSRLTRRGFFVGTLAAAAAAVVAVKVVPEPEPPRSTWNGKTRWVGHC